MAVGRDDKLGLVWLEKVTCMLHFPLHVCSSLDELVAMSIRLSTSPGDL